MVGILPNPKKRGKGRLGTTSQRNDLIASSYGNKLLQCHLRYRLEEVAAFVAF